MQDGPRALRVTFREGLGDLCEDLPDELFVLPGAIAQVILDDRGNVTAGAIFLSTERMHIAAAHMSAERRATQLLDDTR